MKEFFLTSIFSLASLYYSPSALTNEGTTAVIFTMYDNNAVGVSAKLAFQLRGEILSQPGDPLTWYSPVSRRVAIMNLVEKGVNKPNPKSKDKYPLPGAIAKNISCWTFIVQPEDLFPDNTVATDVRSYFTFCTDLSHQIPLSIKPLENSHAHPSEISQYQAKYRDERTQPSVRVVFSNAEPALDTTSTQ